MAVVSLKLGPQVLVLYYNSCSIEYMHTWSVVSMNECSPCPSFLYLLKIIISTYIKLVNSSCPHSYLVGSSATLLQQSVSQEDLMVLECIGIRATLVSIDGEAGYGDTSEVEE